MKTNFQAKPPKRLLAALLALCMIFGMVPLSALTALAADVSINSLVNTESIIARSTFETKNFANTQGGEGVDKIFNGDTSDKLGLAYNEDSKLVTITWEMTESVLLSGYMLYTPNDGADRDVTGWKLFGSADGVTYTEIDSHTDFDTPGGLGSRGAPFAAADFVVANPTAYTYFKLELNQFRAEGFLHAQLSEIRLMGSEASVAPIENSDALVELDFNNMDGEVIPNIGTAAESNGKINFRDGTTEAARAYSSSGVGLLYTRRYSGWGGGVDVPYATAKLAKTINIMHKPTNNNPGEWSRLIDLGSYMDDDRQGTSPRTLRLIYNVERNGRRCLAVELMEKANMHKVGNDWVSDEKWTRLYSQDNLSADKWSLISLTVEDNQIKLYIDGLQVDLSDVQHRDNDADKGVTSQAGWIEDTFGSFVRENGEPLRVSGVVTAWSDDKPTGLLAGVSLYDETMTTEQLTAMYDEYLARMMNVELPTNDMPQELKTAALDMIKTTANRAYKNVGIKNGIIAMENRIAALDAGQYADYFASILAATKNWYNLVDKMYSYEITTEGNPITGLDKTPWMNGLTGDAKESTVAAMNGAIREMLEVKNYNMVRSWWWGDENSANLQVVRLQEHNKMLAREVDAQSDWLADTLTNPWRQGYRKISWVFSPFIGQAFTSTGYFAKEHDKVILSDSFQVGDVMYQVDWDGYYYHDADWEKVNYVDKEDFELSRENGIYPGSGLDADDGANAFRYAYSTYNQANRVNDKVVGYPEANVAKANADAVVYQSFISEDGTAYIAGETAELADAADSNSGKPEGAYLIIGETARAFESLDANEADRFAITGAPTSNAVVNGDIATQDFENGRLVADTSDSTPVYSFLAGDIVAVIDAIDAITTATTLAELKDNLEAAQTAYDLLDEVTEQPLVKNSAQLTAVANAITKIEAAIDAIEHTTTGIDAFGTVTEDNLTAAKSLAADLQGLVDAIPAGFAKYLGDSATKLTNFKAAIASKDKSPEVLAVQALVDAIANTGDGETFTYKDSGAYYKALTAFNRLSAADRAKVDITKLTAAAPKAKAIYDAYEMTHIHTTPPNSEPKFTWSNISSVTAAAGFPWIASSSQSAILAAMNDEARFQYVHEGYNLGFKDNSNCWQEQGKLLIAEMDIAPNDNLAGANPWRGDPFQDSRKWAAVNSPFDGIAFSFTDTRGGTMNDGMALLGNAFEYNGKMYQLQWSRYTVSTNGNRDSVTTTSRFPGSKGTGENVTDVTKNSFRYAAAKYNQDVKWDGKTVGYPESATVEGTNYTYQEFIGPDGVAYIVASNAAISAANADVPTSIAQVITGDVLAALLVLNANLETALATTGAPKGLITIDGSEVFAFENGYVKDGVYKTAENYEKINIAIGELLAPADVTASNYVAANAAIEAIEAMDGFATTDTRIDHTTLNDVKDAVKVFKDRKLLAKVVEDKIALLPATIAKGNQAAIETCRREYDALAVLVQDLFDQPMLAKLVDAENQLKRIIDQEIADDFSARVAELPGYADEDVAQINPGDATLKAQIDALYAEYMGTSAVKLTPAQQLLVSAKASRYLKAAHDRVNPVVSDTITSTVYTVDQTNKIIKKVSSKSTVAEFKANVSPDVIVYAADGTTVAADTAKMNGKMKVKTTSGTVKYDIWVIGDVNDDGELDSADITQVINAMTGKSTDAALIERANVNGDTELDIADISALVNILVGK